MTEPIKRPAEKGAVCRVCDENIYKGDNMVTFYSWRNRGMHVHLHLHCARKIGEEADKK